MMISTGKVSKKRKDVSYEKQKNFIYSFSYDGGLNDTQYATSVIYYGFY